MYSDDSENDSTIEHPEDRQARLAQVRQRAFQRIQNRLNRRHFLPGPVINGQQMPDYHPDNPVDNAPFQPWHPRRGQ